MEWCNVQRSGRTSIRATTRSLSASVKVTPFNCANGIGIELSFSSGVMGRDPLVVPDVCAGMTRVSRTSSKHFPKLMHSRVKRGSDVPVTSAVTTGRSFAISGPMRHFPPRRIVCLTEETVETLYSLGEQDRIVGVSGYAVRPPQVRREKPRVSAFISADIPKILALEPDLVLAFSDLQAGIVADLVRVGVAVHVFNQRDIAGILAMIRTLGGMVDAADRADQLATNYQRRLTDVAAIARPSPKPKVY